MVSEPMKRASFLGVPEAFDLNHACLAVNEAFGLGNTFLVGSCLDRRDYRDVDVRTILDDDVFAQMFPNGGYDHDAFWSLLCASISTWLSKQTGLPVDFQIQQQTKANKDFDGNRSALGIFISRLST